MECFYTFIVENVQFYKKVDQESLNGHHSGLYCSQKCHNTKVNQLLGHLLKISWFVVS